MVGKDQNLVGFKEEVGFTLNLIMDIINILKTLMYGMDKGMYTIKWDIVMFGIIHIMVIHTLDVKEIMEDIMVDIMVEEELLIT